MQITLQIDGMNCQKCCKSIENALYQQDGIEMVEIVLPSKTAMITFMADKISVATIATVIENLGFDVMTA